MSELEIKIPGAAHPILIETAHGTVTVLFNGQAVARSNCALVMREADYPPTYYIPRKDIVSDYLQSSDHDTYCPYKGRAHYWTLNVNGLTSINAAWYYDNAYPAVSAISGYISFYPDRVDAIEVSKAS